MASWTSSREPRAPRVLLQLAHAWVRLRGARLQVRRRRGCAKKYEVLLGPSQKIHHLRVLGKKRWTGFIWMNPPFGNRNGLEPWLDKFFEHRNGVALTPDRTSAPWWRKAAEQTDALLFVSPKIKFYRPDGTRDESPANGTTLFAVGTRWVAALRRAKALGSVFFR